MELMQTAAHMLASRLDTKVGPDSIAQALESLLGGAGGGIDLAGLVTRMMQNGDLQGLAASWLGDGANAAISPEQVTQTLGSVHLTAFAARLGVDSGSAAEGLAEVLPEIVDRASEGGSLLSAASLGGGLSGIAKAFL